MKLSIKCIASVIFLFSKCALLAQSTSVLDSLLLTNKYEIGFSEQGFSGEGIAYIIKNAQNTQFVGIAENHNVKQVPVFTSFLFDALKENYGFNYLVLEQDPVMMKLLSEKKYDVIEMAKTYKSGFTFISDQELKLIDHVVNISKASNNSVWGCDQSFGASHALQEIINNLKIKDKATKTLKSLNNEIYSKEKDRDLELYHYMSELNKTKDLIPFKEAVTNHGEVSSEFYINSLIISDSIYNLIVKKSFYQSRSMRENYMKSRFVEEYKQALKTDTLPKALLKFGHFHLMDGFNTGSLTTNIGGIVRNIAQYNNKEALIINTQVYRDDNSDWDYLEGAYPQFTKHSSVDSWTLFDLRPLRIYDYNGWLSGAIKDENLRNWRSLIYRFDMLLIIGNGTDATWKITKVDY